MVKIKGDKPWFEGEQPSYTKWDMALDSVLTTLHGVADGDMLTKDPTHIYTAIKTIVDLLIEHGEVQSVIDSTTYTSLDVLDILKGVDKPMPGYDSNDDVVWEKIPSDAQVFLLLSLGMKAFQVNYDPNKTQHLDLAKYHEILKSALLSAQEAGLETFFIGGVALNAAFARHLISWRDKSGGK